MKGTIIVSFYVILVVAVTARIFFIIRILIDNVDSTEQPMLDSIHQGQPAVEGK